MKNDKSEIKSPKDDMAELQNSAQENSRGESSEDEIEIGVTHDRDKGKTKGKFKAKGKPAKKIGESFGEAVKVTLAVVFGGVIGIVGVVVGVKLGKDKDS